MSQANAVFWGKEYIFALFVVSIVVIFIFEKKSAKKIIYAGYSALIFVALWNPAVYYVERLVLGSGWKIPYFCRFFSLIPLELIIGYAVVLLFSKLKGLLKFVCVLCFCLLVITFGDNVYTQDWIQRAENFSKFPSDVAEIGSYLEEKADGKPVTLAAPVELTKDIRQYSGNIITPYGRYSDGSQLYKLINEEDSNARELINTLGVNGWEYFAVARNEENETAMARLGQVLLCRTDYYLLYQLRDDNVLRNIYDAQGRVTEKYLDNPLKNTDYQGLRYSYNAKNRVVSITYIDENGNNAVNAHGCGGFLIADPDNKEASEVSFVDINGNAISSGNQNDAILYQERSSGATKNAYGQWEFVTTLEDNNFNAAQMWIRSTKQNPYTYYTIFSTGDTGNYSDEYVHDMSTGIYLLKAKGNTNLRDEGVFYYLYLEQGAKYTWSLPVYQVSSDKVVIGELTFEKVTQ